MQLPDPGHVLALLEEAADKELVPRFAQVEREHKLDGSIVTAADIAVQQRVRAALHESWPQFGFLGEEMDLEAQRAVLSEPDMALWCLDPLDGTSNFAAGIPYFAISLALVVQGEPLLGLVYDPVRKESFTARKGDGAWCNEAIRLRTDVPMPPLQRAVAAVDFKRLAPGLATRLAARPPYSSQRSFGSVALDWCWLAAGRFHVYLHGAQKLWDYAAGSLILDEAGGHAVTLDGERVLQPWAGARSVAAALDSDLFRAWTQWLGVPASGA